MAVLFKSNRTGMMHVFVMKNLTFCRSIFHARYLGLFEGQYIVFKLRMFDLWNGQWQCGGRSFSVRIRRGDGRTSVTTEANHPGPALWSARHIRLHSNRPLPSPHGNPPGWCTLYHDHSSSILNLLSKSMLRDIEQN